MEEIKVLTAEDLEKIAGGAGGTLITAVCKECGYTQTFTTVKKFCDVMRFNPPCTECGSKAGYNLTFG
ncbi:MAG: hypothetical protein LBM59_03420 [Ruminococcus sp.]|jgi:hypothetical protein|nr:hypothetical protein [Ruminococcus sp.]